MRLDHLLSKEEEVENCNVFYCLAIKLKHFWCRCGWGTHPFPSRTRRLRPNRPMVLHWRRCGRAGGRQIKKEKLNLPVMRDFEWNRKKHLRFLMTDKTSVNMYLENCIHEIWLKVNQISLIQNVKGLYESIIQTQDRKTSILIVINSNKNISKTYQKQWESNDHITYARVMKRKVKQ